jgi:hypothetical protein
MSYGIQSPPRNFSLTNENLPIAEIIEPLTLIRQSLSSKEKKLKEDSTLFLEFLTKHDDESNIPYALRSENRLEYKGWVQTIMQALSYSISTAKRIRLELYTTPNEEFKYNLPADTSNLPQPEKKESNLNAIQKVFGLKKTVTFDPNSPMAKMEEIVAGLTEILEIFKRWITWFEGLILEQLTFNTPDSLQSELNELIQVYGDTIETNLWISFQYYRDMREQDAEHHAIEMAKSMQKQEDRERNEFRPPQPILPR